MLIACWSAKGGVGTSVVAAALASVLARRHPAGCVLADLAGDQPAVVGLPEPDGPGLAGWCAAWPEVPDEGLARLEVPAADGLSVLPAGRAPVTGPAAAVADLAQALLVDPRAVVVDVGRVDAADGWRRALLDVASRSLLVVRPCYPGLRRARALDVAPTGVVVVEEPDRALHAEDVAACLEVPVVAVVPVEPAVARAVDAGVLLRRLPRSLARSVGVLT